MSNPGGFNSSAHAAVGSALGWLQPNFNVLGYTFESRKNSCVPPPSINPLSNSCPEGQLITSRPPSPRWLRPQRLACSSIEKYIIIRFGSNSVK